MLTTEEAAKLKCRIKSLPYNILFVLLHKNYNKKRIIWIKFIRIIQI